VANIHFINLTPEIFMNDFLKKYLTAGHIAVMIAVIEGGLPAVF